MTSFHATSSSCTLDLDPALPLMGGSTIHISGLDYPLSNASTEVNQISLQRLTNVPTGMHFFAWDPPSSASVQSSLPPGFTNRVGFFAHLTYDGQVVRRDLSSGHRSGSKGAVLSRSAARQEPTGNKRSTQLSFPLPTSSWQSWQRATASLDKRPDTLQRVLGDQLSCCTSDELAHPERPLCAGKISSAEQKLEESLRTARRRDVSGDELAAKEEELDRRLHFTQVPLRKSWVNTVGEERTRWSLDKSLALRKAVDSLAGDLTALLAEFELSFVLFVSLSSPAALSHWQCFVELFCRSRAAMGAQSIHQVSGQGLEAVLHGASSTAVAAPAVNGSAAASNGSKSSATDYRIPELHAAFMQTLCAQINLLDTETLLGDQSSSDNLAYWLSQELHLLRSAVTDTLAISASPSSIATTPSNTDRCDPSEKLISCWRVLARVFREKSGVDLDERNDEEILLQEQELFERGIQMGAEDAPVVVDL
ncbi:mRNA splicing factor [Ceraceosorus bombacis]|uniref:mRNA splicing factor n=1 Tax=Ceraceosorus bombacis TaxID=401625 RepID=A0A0P1BFJ1_9BASI|nr:mRNA splicing factor [Ceraceosorus bombacis]